MVEKIMSADGKTSLVMTGPLTDLARALKAEPAIETKIDACAGWVGQWMTAAMSPNLSRTAPLSGTLTGTQRRLKRYLRPQFRFRWSASNRPPNSIDARHSAALAKLRRYAAIDLMGQGYALVPPLEHFETNSTYYLWDVLNTVASEYPDIVSTKQVQGDVLTTGPGAGRTFETATGRPITLVTEVDQQAFFDQVDDLAKRASTLN